MAGRWIAIMAAAAMMMSCGGAERDYATLHKNSLVVDLHSDTPLRMPRGFDIAVRDTSGHMDIPRLKEGGIDLQVFACFVSTDRAADSCRSRVDQLIDSIEAQVGRNPDDIAICTTADQAESIIASGRIAAFIGIENGVAIENNLDNLQHFYDRGVRYLTLTHVASSEWCISSGDTLPAFHGLTDFGRDVVRKMNELGMIVDVSHASVSAFEEALKVTTDPIIASHSCVHAICGHDRNLTDEEIKALAANGGVIGINFFDGYLAPGNRWWKIVDSISDVHKAAIDSLEKLYEDDWSEYRKAMKPYYEMMHEMTSELGIDVATVVDHIDYIVNLVGPDYVGLGSDFDGVGDLPDGLGDCSMVPNITEELVQRGYTDENIKKILGGNFMRVFRQVCDK
jgi:membrane dipeptidase